MVKVKNTYFSPVKPRDPNCVWLKPVNGGFAAYLIDAGYEKPLKLVEDNGTPAEGDDTIAKTTAATKSELIGTAEDTKTANTINGAKAYADDITQATYAEVLGDPTDAASNMTLYGLKAYIDGQLASID